MNLGEYHSKQYPARENMFVYKNKEKEGNFTRNTHVDMMIVTSTIKASDTVKWNATIKENVTGKAYATVKANAGVSTQ